MAGDWIKVRKALPNDPRIVRMASALHADRFRTLGGILSAWCLFDEHTDCGQLDGYTPALLDEVVGFPGLAAAMEKVGWLEVGENFLIAPRFEKHNGRTAKRRAQEAVRKLSARDADKRPHAKPPKSGLEKRREEKRSLSLKSPRQRGERSERGKKFLEVEKHIRGLKPSWDIALTLKECDLLGYNLRCVDSMKPDDWTILRDYLRAKLPKGEPDERPRLRGKLIEWLPDVLAAAREWQRKQINKTPPPPPMVRPRVIMSREEIAAGLKGEDAA